jgi:hypothetical protein
MAKRTWIRSYNNADYIRQKRDALTKWEHVIALVQSQTKPPANVVGIDRAASLEDHRGRRSCVFYTVKKDSHFKIPGRIFIFVTALAWASIGDENAWLRSHLSLVERSESC